MRKKCLKIFYQTTVKELKQSKPKGELIVYVVFTKEQKIL